MTPLYESARESLLCRRQAIERHVRGGPSEAERREVEEIEAALTRLASGAYGCCEACGRAIGRLRLRAVPEARRCDAC